MVTERYTIDLPDGAYSLPVLLPVTHLVLAISAAEGTLLERV